MTDLTKTIRAPLEVVALFAHEAPADLGFLGRRPPRATASVLPEVPPLVAPQSELVLLLTPEERSAAAAARVALLLRYDESIPSPEMRVACADHILECRELGAVAIALPAARRVIGPSALAALAPALSESQGLLKLFVQFHVVQTDHYAWSHTHGMAHYGLPDLECRTTLADRELATRLLEGAMAYLLEGGADALQPGNLIEAAEPDGRFLARFRVYPSQPVEGHRYDAWGAFEIVPVPAAAQPQHAHEQSTDARSLLTACLISKRRACDLELQGAALAGVDLSGLSADRLDLSQADLHGATLRHARLGGCRLLQAQLEQIECSAATLRMCALDGAHAAGARFDDARIEDSSAKGADLTRASLRRARLTETSFERSILREAVLDETVGDGVELRGADLSGASLHGARLDEADFRGADLRGADLSHGRFRGADFRGALLDGARLDGADCTGARFDAGEGPHTDTAPKDRAHSDAQLEQAALAALREGRAALSSALSCGSGAAPGDLPDDLKRWLEPLMKLAETAPGSALLDQLQRAVGHEEAGATEPPEALKPVLEPLMKALNDGRGLDPKTLLDALSSFAQDSPARPSGPAPPA